jgi:hypothetical protein
MLAAGTDRVSREGMENVARVYEGWILVSRGICLTCSQSHQGSSLLRKGDISSCRQGVLVSTPRPVAAPARRRSGPQPRSCDRSAKRAGRDPRRAVAGEAGDSMDTHSLNGLSEDHRRQDGGEPPCEHRLARPRGAEQEQIMVTTPASPSASPELLQVPMVMAVNPLSTQEYR